jgi:hypothetical protein
MKSFFGSTLTAELRGAARQLGLATIAADKGEVASVQACLGELAAKIDALRLGQAP